MVRWKDLCVTLINDFLWCGTSFSVIIIRKCTRRTNGTCCEHCSSFTTRSTDWVLNVNIMYILRIPCSFKLGIFVVLSCRHKFAGKKSIKAIRNEMIPSYSSSNVVPDNLGKFMIFSFILFYGSTSIQFFVLPSHFTAILNLFRTLYGLKVKCTFHAILCWLLVTSSYNSFQEETKTFLAIGLWTVFRAVFLFTFLLFSVKISWY